MIAIKKNRRGDVMSHLTLWLDNYGYFTLYFALALELIALPTPGEMLMTYCGYLVYEGKLSYFPSILAAAAGAITGISISYFLGYTLGHEFFERYGRFFHITEDRLEKISKSFEVYGSKLLIVAYYIPGVRHLTGYFSGITRINYKKFAANAYAGAFIWAASFITIGKVLGSNWDKLHEYAGKYVFEMAAAAGVVILAFFLYKKNSVAINKGIDSLIKRSVEFFHSFARIKVLLIAAASMFIVITAALVYYTEAYLSDNINRFDEIMRLITFRVFGEGAKWAGAVSFLTHPLFIVMLSIIFSVGIMLKSKRNYIDALFITVTIIAGTLAVPLINSELKRYGRFFPGDGIILVVILFGFAAYYYSRHTSRKFLIPVYWTIFAAICLACGIGAVFSKNLLPSDVVAGYLLGLLWLLLDIILLEIFRILTRLKREEKSS